MTRVPKDFGGLLGSWAEGRALVVRYALGEPIQGLVLDPLNLLQTRKLLDQLIADGRRRGLITEEHERQSAELPAMPPEEVVMNVVHRTTGGA